MQASDDQIDQDGIEEDLEDIEEKDEEPEKQDEPENCK